MKGLFVLVWPIPLVHWIDSPYRDLKFILALGCLLSPLIFLIFKFMGLYF